jgi:hypothetical protein
MRVFACGIAVVLCAACGGSPAPQPVAPPPSAAPSAVNPARVDRVRSNLPAGYEFAAIAAPSAPVTLWGFGTGWTADPAPCGVLGDPASDAAVRGWSASGQGGIVYAVVAVADSGPPNRDGCDTWTLSAGHTSGIVRLVAAPAVGGATTLGMVVSTTTVVEGGGETHSYADTFIAYLGDHVVYTTVVTDPGSSGSSLGAGFASDLLVKTVAAIRG